jgi:carboxyl-terminal processing protease
MSERERPNSTEASLNHPIDDQELAGWQQPQRRSRTGRASLYAALFLVAVLGGSALFVSGFTLGRLDWATPGTSASRQELFRPFWDAYNDVTLNYVGEVNQEELRDGAIKGIFQALGDPYSAYMTQKEYRDSLTSLSGEFEGIGATLTTVDPDGAQCETISPTCRLTIVHVVRQSPALRAGLQVGDVVTAVDDKPTLESSLELVIDLIRGPKGTSVRLTIERNGEPRELSIVRDVIQSEHVRSEVLADGRVGYLKIENFSSGAARDLRDQLRALVRDERIEALILDLRDDPGGYVDAARRVASEFVADGPLFWEQSARGEPVPANVEPGGVATDPELEVAVLVNRGTASASEIVAGSLQGNGRALLVGEPTFGKGTIQEWKEIAGAGGYRLSVRRWLMPDQTWIHGRGLMPDVAVTPTMGAQPTDDPVLERGLELLLDNTRSAAPTGSLVFRLPLAA